MSPLAGKNSAVWQHQEWCNDHAPDSLARTLPSGSTRSGVMTTRLTRWQELCRLAAPGVV
ncbi:TPA: hypothetical protein HHS83_004029 [Escherichia coli]|uniref:hypothetical protein n=1 Tax=Escherichia coli TaxID=562 RepID=UPI0010C05E2A|nr:hypothetical protein [Escherichia coli]EEQ6154925.1 hypothetical protein [Escherichia coli]EER0041332.1 hypothetical protein [Escherichia coli]EER6788593.1 hypothetical protein [Escherichia coli]EER8130542.1 hypothetical protein [Escherichia coli]EER8263665.1 hypothetical protein [Escherichia coli]